MHVPAGQTWWTWHRTPLYSLGRIPRSSQSHQTGGRPPQRRDPRKPSKPTIPYMGESCTPLSSMMHLLLTYANILMPSEAVLQHSLASLCLQASGEVLGRSGLKVALWTMRRPGNAQSAAQPGSGIWGGAMAAMTGGRPPPQSPPPAPPPAAAQPENLEVPALVSCSPHPIYCVKPIIQQGGAVTS